MAETNGLMTKGEVATFTRYGTRTIDRWMARGWLRFVKLPNGQVRFRRTDVVNAVDQYQNEQFKSDGKETDPSMG